MTDLTPVALLSGAGLPMISIADALLTAGYDLVWHSPEPPPASLCYHAERQGKRLLRIQGELHAPPAAAALLRDIRQSMGQLDLVVQIPQHRATLPFGSGHGDTIAQQLEPLADLAIAAAPLLEITQGSLIWLLDWPLLHQQMDWQKQIAHATLEEAVRALAQELAPEIRVNAIRYPSYHLNPPPSDDPLQQKRLLHQVALKRPLHVEDIADAVKYLASARYLTGHILPLDGGYSRT